MNSENYRQQKDISDVEPLNEKIDRADQREIGELSDTELDSVDGGMTPVRNLRG